MDLLRAAGTVTLLAALLGGEARAATEPAVSVERRTGDERVSARLLRTLPMDVLGRPPLASERETWTALGRAELVDVLLGGRELWERWLEEQLYYFLLIDNFRPQAERIAAIPGDLHDGKLDVRSALHRVALSSSFEQRNPGADTFVTVVLEQLAGLEVQHHLRELEIGKRIYEGAEGSFLGQPGKTQADVVRIAIESPQFARHFVAREHVRLVHAKAEPKALAAWAARLHKDPRTYREIVREWLLSPAYTARLEAGAPQENRLFVRSLYVDLVGRVPGREEAEPLREALDGLADPAPLRSVIARLLLDSDKVALPDRDALGDAGAWVQGLFERLLGRAPTPEEQKTFTASLADPGCRPQTVVYALVSSPEYSRY
jgi:hypothetical protein